jgi:hypothetical protein
VHAKGCRAHNVEESGRSGQRGDPQSAVGVAGGHRRERAVGKEPAEAAAEIRGVKHSGQPLRRVADACPPLDGELPVVKTHGPSSGANGKDRL